MSYEIRKLDLMPDRKERVTKANWPLEALTVGTSFNVPASENARFQACRMAVTRYNKAHGTNIATTMQQDGSLLVWRDNDDNITDILKLAPVTIVAKQQPTEQPKTGPTAEQFVNWLETFAVGQSQVIGKDQQTNFMQFCDWIKAYNLTQDKAFEYSLTAEGLTITLAPVIFANSPNAPSYQE